MSKTYAIADLHGRFDLLEAALEKIQEHSPDGGKVVFLGDYVDRGPQSSQIIERLMAGAPEGWEWVCLKGNHEDMMVDHCRTGFNLDLWMTNGGGSTLVSYGHPTSGNIDLTVVPAAHLAWVDKLPLYHEDEHRVFVHAGCAPLVPLADQSEQKLIWTIYPEGHPGGHGKKFVVHGHEQFADGPKVHLGRVDLDTFAWATGRLVVGVFDDHEPGHPVEYIECIAAPDPRFSKT